MKISEEGGLTKKGVKQLAQQTPVCFTHHHLDGQNDGSNAGKQQLLVLVGEFSAGAVFLQNLLVNRQRLGKLLFVLLDMRKSRMKMVYEENVHSLHHGRQIGRLFHLRSLLIRIRWALGRLGGFGSFLDCHLVCQTKPIGYSYFFR